MVVVDWQVLVLQWVFPRKCFAALLLRTYFLTPQLQCARLGSSYWSWHPEPDHSNVSLPGTSLKQHQACRILTPNCIGAVYVSQSNVEVLEKELGVFTEQPLGAYC